MSLAIRVFDGRFGRLKLLEVREPVALGPRSEPQVLALVEGAPLALDPAPAEEAAATLGREQLVFVNPGERFALAPADGDPGASAQLLLLQLAEGWVRARFPAAFARGARPFPARREPITPRLRQLADLLALEALADQFLAADRLEFMVEDTMFSIAETYLARRAGGARFWRGSPFADSRIRRALALLRARPTKALNMDEVAARVGLSRSRFYDLFHLSTGFSPRAFLDKLCVESAIARLAAGRGRIAEVSSELGFSAQSNFTRFFQHHVGIAPSAYRAALRRLQGSGGGERRD
ncbi:MAG: AraC family transcriptional regulator [Burkholderiales bacterium]|nr:AraC family transcriptional regulator [Burkholderiales bacterium]